MENDAYGDPLKDLLDSPEVQLGSLRNRRDKAAKEFKEASRLLDEALKRHRETYAEHAQADREYINLCKELGVKPE